MLVCYILYIQIILVWRDQGCASGVLDEVGRGVDVVSRLFFYTMVAMRDEVCEDQ
mgnify:CR=1 FL=1